MKVREKSAAEKVQIPRERALQILRRLRQLEDKLRDVSGSKGFAVENQRERGGRPPLQSHYSPAKRKRSDP